MTEGVRAGTTDLEIRVPPPFAGRRVRATLKVLCADGVPLPDGSVALWPVSYSKIPFTAVPICDGKADIDVEIPSPVKLQFVVMASRGPGRAPSRWLHAIVLEEAVERAGGTLEVRLDEAREIRGRVLFDGKPVARQLFVAKQERTLSTPAVWMENHHSVISGQDGVFQVGGLVPGKFRIVSANDAYIADPPVVVESGTTGITVHLRWAVKTRVHGRILPPAVSV